MIDKTTPAPLLDLSIKSLYGNLSDRTLASLDLSLFPQAPSNYLQKIRESTLLQHLSNHEGQALSAEDFQGFRFHQDAKSWAAAGHYATACQLSLMRTLEEAGSQPITIEHSRFAPRQLNDMRGIDKLGNVHVSSHGMEGPDELNSLSAGVPTRLTDLPDGLQRFVQPLTSGLTTCLSKSHIKPPAQPELLHNRAGDLILLNTAGQLSRLDSFPEASCRQPSSLRSVQLSANGRFAALLPDSSPIRLYNLETGARLPVPRVSCIDMSVCRALVTNNGTLYVATQPTSQQVTPEGAVLTLSDMDQIFALSPDERFLLYRNSSDRAGDFILRDLHNHNDIPVKRTHADSFTLSNTPSSIAFSPLNALLAVAYGDGGVEVFNLMNADANGARALASTRIPVQIGAFSCPLISFDKGFDRLQVVSYGDNNQLNVNSLTLGS